ncbi:MAG TPA: NAD-dependent epimerase/dehydratase family protein [Dehalococcoidia bacterium]|nr:NAD-dependent epimerase/dehydratase family protein [Dehalococcoidia bacterium]
MAKCLVTGAAGFIGSHLSERLLRDGHEVVGVDCFTEYYDRAQKLANLANLRQASRFALIEADLIGLDLAKQLEGVEFVFHLAGQPGVRASWGSSFDIYLRNNVLATQELLEAAKGGALRKLVFASSSSIYGDVESFPTAETALPQPVSPYGVSKLAAEHLCYLYWKNYQVPTVSVRYFTVYGPRQRPDMAFHRFVRALLADQPIEVFGDGEQTRDFTFVADAVEGTVSAAFAEVRGEVFNLGGGSRVTLNQVLATLEAISGRPVRRAHVGAQKGDVRHTSADTRKAQRLIGYRPRVDLATGLAHELQWVEGL